jgi:hypothetical protein
MKHKLKRTGNKKKNLTKLLHRWFATRHLGKVFDMACCKRLSRLGHVLKSRIETNKSCESLGIKVNAH